jgi:predicted HicB family RNase H-like nuclease
MTVLKYKDYQGSVTYEDGTLFIKILHISDLVVGECEGASEVQRCFEQLVDDYVESCEKVGKSPDKPFKGSLNVRLGADLHKRAAFAAAQADETLNAWIANSIEQRLETKLEKGLSSHDIQEIGYHLAMAQVEKVAAERVKARSFKFRSKQVETYTLEQVKIPKEKIKLLAKAKPSEWKLN